MKSKLRTGILAGIIGIAATAILVAKPTNLYKRDTVPPVVHAPNVKWIGNLVYLEDYSEGGRRYRNLMSHDGVEVGIRDDGVMVWRAAATRVVKE